jgi:SNF2 family DNA or RNA helicase
LPAWQSVQKRHRYIRDFQEREPRAKIFVVTLKTGSVGVTLTAATRVYAAPPPPLSERFVRS